MRGTRAPTSVLLAGLVLLVVGAAQLHATVLAPEPYQLLGSTRLPWWMVFGLLVSGTSYALGLPELPTSRRSVLVRSVMASAVGMLGVSMVQLITAGALLPRSGLGVFVVVSPLWALIVWNLAADAEEWSRERDRALVICRRPEDAAALHEELGRNPEAPAKLVGTLLLDEIERAGPAIIRTTTSDLRPTVIVLDASAQGVPLVVREVADLHREGMRVRTLALFYEEWLAKLPVSDLQQVALLFDIGGLHRAQFMRAKRIVDVLIGVIGTVFLVPISGFVLVGNLFGNRGPLLFKQERVGQGGEVFTILKFRSMTPGGAEHWTQEDDPRITPFGHFLRRSHLDEVPQMLNLLRGDLSFVGPRPEQVSYVELLTDKVPFYDIRHLVRPGLTGWAQVKQGYAADEADAIEKLQYDIYYLRRQGPALDTKIVWRTVRGIVTTGGR